MGTVKFTGEVLQNVKNVRYEIDMKKIMSPGGTTVGPVSYTHLTLPRRLRFRCYVATGRFFSRLAWKSRKRKGFGCGYCKIYR